jgi:hypothetical protein
MERFDAVVSHLLWIVVFFGAGLLLPVLMPVSLLAVAILGVSAVRTAVRG